MCYSLNAGTGKAGKFFQGADNKVHNSLNPFVPDASEAPGEQGEAKTAEDAEVKCE
jgi:hypothetical protein